MSWCPSFCDKPPEFKVNNDRSCNCQCTSNCCFPFFRKRRKSEDCQIHQTATQIINGTESVRQLIDSENDQRMYDIAVSSIHKERTVHSDSTDQRMYDIAVDTWERKNSSQKKKKKMPKKLKEGIN